jgi:hypothetical protein
MALTFFLSSQAADRFLNQAERQLDTARKVSGELAAAVAVNNVQRSEKLYGQVNTFLGLTTTSNSSAKREINDMARDARLEPERQLVQTYTARSRDIDTGIESVRSTSTRLIGELNRDTYNLENNTPRPPVTSSAADAIEAQNAANEGSRTQDPTSPLQTFDDDGRLIDIPNNVSDETNANLPRLLGGPEDLGNDDGATVVGGNRPTRTLTQTQGPFASQSPPDDQRDQSASITGAGVTDGGRPAIAPEFLAPIVPTPNPLSKLASMNYSFSIYMLNIEEYKRMLGARGKKVLPSQQLIIQSGGMNQGAGFNTGQRNKYFDVDFYLDDVKIQSSIGTQGGTRAHNALSMQFTVVEPTGITFIQRLRKAVREHQAGGNSVSEGNQNFLMIIRFYGYDANGQIVNSSELGIKEVGSDTNSIVEKWIPFQIADIRYKLSSRQVEYNIIATVPQTVLGFSTMTATIPFDFELQAPDVATLLNGKTSLTRQANATEDDVRDREGSSQPPPNAVPLSAIKQYTNGLAEALNEYQRELVSKKQQEKADQYEIILANVKGLSDAKIARPGKQDKKRASTAPPATANQTLNPQASSYNNNSKTWNVTRGTQIVQLIDLVMRNSSYITSQQNIRQDEATQKWYTQTPVATVQWYRIQCQATPLEYDNIRRTNSYKIVYTVTPYQINDPKVPAFPTAPFRGTHKVYNYWFTGENSEVLDLEIQTDFNYTMSFAANQGGLPPGDEWTSSARIYEKRYFQTKPNSEGTGGQGDTTTPAAELAARLYQDQDLQKSNLTILGDPDWLQQSEVFYTDPTQVYLSPFMPDGSVNTAASEVLYEIKINPVNDYNLLDGLATINSNGGLYGQNTATIVLEPQSTVFNALKVHSNFRQGRFTQRLEGALRQFNAAKAIISVGAERNRLWTAADQEDADTGAAMLALGNRTAADRARYSTGTVPAPNPPATATNDTPALRQNIVQLLRSSANGNSEDATDTSAPTLGGP